MKLKKILAIAVSAAVVTAMGAVMASAAVPDFVIVDPNGSPNGFVANGIGDDNSGYWGPYGQFTLDSGNWIYDASVANGYTAINLHNDGVKVSDYKYLVMTAKTDDATAVSGVSFSIGQPDDSSADVYAKDLKDWKLADGSTGINLTTSFKTFTIDLAANGVVTFASSKNPGDFTFHPGDATKGKVYVNKLVLTNTDPNSSSGTPSSSSKPSSATSSGSGSGSSNAKTGDTFPIAVFSLFAIGSAAALTVVAVKARKHN